mmetsp:Transcript_850/g.1897  ORF Transcript_850/g.1897 Transcript_850/m.1897 type:complete len:213 (-) Transcript_850:494-1132(-)
MQHELQEPHGDRPPSQHFDLPQDDQFPQPALSLLSLALRPSTTDSSSRPLLRKNSTSACAASNASRHSISSACLRASSSRSPLSGSASEVSSESTAAPVCPVLDASIVAWRLAVTVLNSSFLLFNTDASSRASSRSLRSSFICRKNSPSRGVVRSTFLGLRGLLVEENGMAKGGTRGLFSSLRSAFISSFNCRVSLVFLCASSWTTSTCVLK